MSQPESAEILPPGAFARGLSGWLLGLILGPLSIFYIGFKAVERVPVLMGLLATVLLVGMLVAHFWAMIHFGHWLKERGLLACFSVGILVLPAIWVYHRSQLPPGNLVDLALLWIGIGLGMLLEPTGRLSDRMRAMDPGSFWWGILAGLVMFGLIQGLAALLPDQVMSSTPMWAKGVAGLLLGALTAVLTHRILFRMWPIVSLAVMSAIVVVLSPLLRRLPEITSVPPILIALWVLGLAVGMVIARLESKPKSQAA